MMKPDNSDTSLASAHEGDICTIVKITASGTIKKRLLEMGLIPGITIKVVKYAPLMDPMEIVVKGVHTSIRVAEASRIIVGLYDHPIDRGAQ
jgi:Fe2+ transport system protein FeoA